MCFVSWNAAVVCACVRAVYVLRGPLLITAQATTHTHTPSPHIPTYEQTDAQVWKITAITRGQPAWNPSDHTPKTGQRKARPCAPARTHGHLRTQSITHAPYTHTSQHRHTYIHTTTRRTTPSPLQTDTTRITTTHIYAHTQTNTLKWQSPAPQAARPRSSGGAAWHLRWKSLAPQGCQISHLRRRSIVPQAAKPRTSGSESSHQVVKPRTSSGETSHLSGET
jgi:hypothetical protein